MPEIVRSALVEHSAARMFALVNDIAAYPRRFDWCRAAEVLVDEGRYAVIRRRQTFDEMIAGELPANDWKTA